VTGILRRFGSRNHPETLARKRAQQRQLDSMEATPEMLANYTAARAFLYGQWFGASLMVASFTLLYVLAVVPRRPSVPVTLAVCAALLGLGTFVYLRNRAYSKRLDYPYAPRWEAAALVVAGSAGIFWLLFAILQALTAAGIRVT
jgi:hypothetical protein